MGMSLITEVRYGRSGPVLQVDLGANRFYRYSVGSGVRRRATGPGGWIEFEELDGVSYTSPMRSRLGTGAFQTRVIVELDPTVIDRQHRQVQVTSFREADGTGPAWSRVVQVVPWAGGTIDGLPEFRRPPMTAGGLAAAAVSTRSVPMTLRESSMSAAMDWGALLGLVDDLAPLAQQVLHLAGDEEVQEGATGLVKILGPLLQNLMGGAGSLAGGLIGGGSGTGGNAANPSGAPAVAPVVAAPFPPGTGTPLQPLVLYQPCPPGAAPAIPGAAVPTNPAATPVLVGATPSSAGTVGRAMDYGVVSIPAIVGLISAVAPAAMKALGPLLEKSPQMFQTYMDHPIKMLNALGELERQDQVLINQQVDKLLAQGNQQLLMTMLQGLGQGGETNSATPAALAGLINVGTTQSIGRPRRERAGRPLSAVLRARARSLTALPAPVDTGGSRRLDGRIVDKRIEAILTPPPPIPGLATTKALYAAGHPVGLQLSLATPQTPPDRPIPQVVAHVRLSDAATGELLLERRVVLPAVFLNHPTVVALDSASVATLPVGRDLTASVDVTWTGSEGRAYTTARRAVQNLCLAGEAFIANLGHRVGDETALSDPQRQRAFWHRIWEGGSAAHSRWELNATTRYYYTMAVDQPTNARMETKWRAIEERSKDTGSKVEWGGLLKSGMELSPDVLNLLLPEMGEQDDSSWSPEELTALRSQIVARSMATKAEFDVHLRGRTEERGAVWVFPVVSLVEFGLHRPSSVDKHGAITATTIEMKRFPLPLAAVVVGMENEG